MKKAITLLFFLISIGLQAQIQLRITDKITGSPLENVRVRAENLPFQRTNSSGIVAFPGERLQISFALEGYEFLQKTFESGEHEVQLVPTIMNLGAVTVQAFESERPLLEQSAAISTVSERDFGRFNEISPVNAFNQKAGVRIEERAPASYRVSIRGSSLRSPFGVRNVKVYWNEVPFTSPDGTTALNLLDLSNIRTAEVIKGPSGSIYGAGNGGAISLWSQANLAGNRLSAEYLAGDFGLSRFRLGLAQEIGNGGIEASFVSQKSDGYRQHSAVDRQVFQLGGYFPVSEKQEIRTQLLISDLDYQIPGALNADQLAADPTQARPGSVNQNSSISQQAVLFSLGHTYKFSDRTNNTTTVYVNTNDFENPFILDYKKELGFGYGARTKFVHEGTLGGKSLRLIGGAEYQNSLTDAQNFGNRNGVADTVRFADKLRAYQGFLFQQAEWNLANKLLFTLGLSENFSGYEIDRLIDASGKPTGLSKRTFDPVVVPRVALNYQLGQFSSVYGSVSGGFSPPTIDEVRTNEGSVNLDLEAEKGTNFEVGYRLGKERFNVELIGYYLKLDQTITTFTNANGVVLFRNAGSTDQKGIEASVDYAILRNGNGFIRDFLVGTAYTGQFFTFVDYKKGSNDFSGNDLTGVPPHNLVSRLDLRTRCGIYLNFTHQFTEEIPLNDANTVYQEAYNLVNLRVGFVRTFGKIDLEAFVGVDNLLDESYSLGNDLNAFGGRFYQPAPIRNWYGGLKLGLNY
ncbi:iron complex outermembrane receptor protein [Algoriphagus boseongensis]|uniref:Iron complex outermembrane receptor protein n=1 Tax=Algoriphagus boseongensis TaxID=1442587 RepID=A0A4R6T5S6_9BACT|nr:TonB-dependent receptor [Algoriphagus boseongensis]TDQ17354.1 iron complex outermembrane receptor protein [Algoriphagus boseongensis]